MSTNYERLKFLLLKNTARQCDEAELDELFDLIDEIDDDELALIFDQIFKEVPHISTEDKVDWEKMQIHILKHPQEKTAKYKRRRLTTKYLTIAATLVMILIFGSFYLIKFFADAEEHRFSANISDVNAPTQNRSTLTLDDGTVVTLDSQNHGVIAQYNDIQVVKTQARQINYRVQAGENKGTLRYHTLTNPRGSKLVDVTLSDGSRVWLNAGSSLRFPVVFVGNERIVEITGEGYFEVAHNKEKAFFVRKGSMAVKVLGTKFNVNAYADGADIKVTLLEGSVSVSTGDKNTLLQPNQQAKIIGKNIEVDKQVNLESVMGWKNGLFSFSGATLEEVMAQIARWYNLDVVYEGEIMTKRFGGKIFKEANLSEVMKILEASGIHYELKNQKTIMIKEK